MPVFMPKAIRQVRRDVELAAADVDLALGRLAKRDDARIQPVNQRAERKQDRARRLGRIFKP